MTTARRVIVATAAIPLALLLTFASLPWIALSIGAGIAGDSKLEDKLIDTCPLSHWLNRNEHHNRF